MPFNTKKHSDITVTVSGDGPGDSHKTFHLHKFPLISKSQYFDDNIPESSTAGPTEMIVTDFPGGPNAFELVARYCYGIDIELTVDNIAYAYCACRVLRIHDLEKSTESFMTEVVLRDPAKATVVLKIAGGIACMSDAMMEGIIGHCINAVASMFSPLPELNALPAEVFSCILRTARDMDANKKMLETAVIAFCESHIRDDVPTGVKMTVEEFIDVVGAPSTRMDDYAHAAHVYEFLERMLRHYKADADAEALCKGLHEIGFWVCLPHVVIERSYSDRNIPDRYCTVALMAENRALIKENERLAAQNDQLASGHRAEAAATGAFTAPH